MLFAILFMAHRQHKNNLQHSKHIAHSGGLFVVGLLIDTADQ